MRLCEVIILTPTASVPLNYTPLRSILHPSHSKSRLTRSRESNLTPRNSVSVKQFILIELCNSSVNNCNIK